MASNRPLLLAVSITLALGAASPSARAQPSPSASERETARSLMTEGRDRRARGDLKGALAAFKAADAIMHVPTTALEAIRSQIALGQLVEARGAIRELFRAPVRPDEPKPFAEARATALSLDGELAARIPSIHVVLENAPLDPHVRIDGVPLPAEALTAPVKVDPGHHVVEAGDGTARAEITVAEKEDKSVTLVLPPLPAVAADPATPASTEAASAGGESHPARIVAMASFGVAGAGLLVGAITGIVSIQKTSTLKGSCDGNQCPSSSASDLDTARSMATVSTLAFVVAGVGAGVGVGALLIGDKHSEKTTVGVQVTPWVGLGSAGVRGTF